MDIKQLNALLLPFNIEIICEGCSISGKGPEPPISRAFLQAQPSGLPEPHFPAARAEENGKSGRKKTICKSRKTLERVPAPEQPQGGFRPARGGTAFESPQRNYSSFRLAYGRAVHPPNQILNLNVRDPRLARKPELFVPLEEPMRTPHKIGDVNIDHLMFSGKKGFRARHHLTGSTLEDAVFDLEDFPEAKANDSPEGPEHKDHNHMALSGVPSMIGSPCFTPIKYKEATPTSRVIRSPNSVLSVSPIPRISSLSEGLGRRNTDFPLNLFYNAL